MARGETCRPEGSARHYQKLYAAGNSGDLSDRKYPEGGLKPDCENLLSQFVLSVFIFDTDQCPGMSGGDHIIDDHLLYSIQSKENGAGKMEIEFFSHEELERITEFFMKKSDH